MKNLVVILLFLAGCTKPDPSIEGSYIHDRDTLVVYDYNSAGIYLIRRSNKYKLEVMYGEYDFNSRKLIDNRYGRMFSFRDDEVLFGTVPYKKVKR